MHENMESKINLLEMRNANMEADIGDIKDSLKDIAKAMQSLAVLEQKHLDSFDAIKRAHKRVDDHEDRIRKVELSTASHLWMERVVWIAAAFAINYSLSVLVK